MKRIVINQEGLKGAELVRNYLDLTPRARIRLLDKIKSALPETHLSTRDQLETLHSKAQANLQTQKGLIPFQLNFDKKIFEEITSVTNDAIVALLDFIQKITDLKLEKVLNPISDKEVEEVLRDTATTKEQKVQKLLERIGNQSHVVLEEDMSYTPLDMKLFAPAFIINSQVQRPNTLNQLLSDGNHMQLLNLGGSIAAIAQEDTCLLGGWINNHETRSSEFYEQPFSDKEDIAKLLEMQNDLIYQIVHNLKLDDMQGPCSSISISAKDLSMMQMLMIDENIAKRDADFLRKALSNDPQEVEQAERYRQSKEYPVLPQPLGFSSIALILNRIRKANLAYIYGDTRFFLKREEAVK